MKSMAIRTGMVALLAALLFTTGLPPAPAAAVGGSPTLTNPVSNSILTSFGPTLTWTNPPGATQVHLQVIPYNNDGASIDLYFGSATARFSVPPPPAWYGMLPDMTYTWRVRVSDKTTAASLTDPSWGPWVERKFRTPAVSSSTIMPLTPAVGDKVGTLTPIVQWSNSRSDVFYYEIQLSKDSTFNTDPNSATAIVYGEYKHGGVTSPFNSYSVPTGSPLENGITYYWRIRPRVQGDGAPVGWSTAFNFQTDLSAKPSMTAEVAKFSLNAADSSTCEMSGVATSFASTPTLTAVHYSFKYTGSGAISRNWYRDEAPISAIGIELEGTSGCFRSAFGTLGIPGGGPSAGRPMRPGTYRLEFWHAGQKIQTSTFTVTPATALAIGPISVGTTMGANCTISGIDSTFPSGIQTIAFHWNIVGTGTYSARVYRGTTVIPLTPRSVSGPIDCYVEGSPVQGGWSSGAYRLELLIGEQVVQSATWTVG